MAGIVKMAKHAWKYLEWLKMAEHGWKEMETAGNYWNGEKWLAMA